MRPAVRLALYALSPLLLCIGSHASVSAPAPSPIVAHIADRAITLRELDDAAGRPVYDATSQLYEARVRALYQLLSNEVLQREAALRGISEEQLIEHAVTRTVHPATDAEIEKLLATARAAPAQDAKTRKQAQLYLGLKRQADAKREFVASLFDKHQVRVSLIAPDPPPAEEIRGAQVPALGKSSAPVAIIAFSDYQCPYCRELSQTLESVLARYPEAVRVIYRHYPLGEASEQWSHAALCADDQQAFARYHQHLFSRDLRGVDPMQVAVALELEPSAFQACMTERRHQSRIDADKAEAQRLDIRGTPTLFVAGLRFRGAQTLEQLIDAVEQARSRTRLVPASSPQRR